MTPFESVRQMELATSALRRAIATARQVAARVGLEVPADLAAGGEATLADWLDAQLAGFAAAASTAGVNPTDPRYRRGWGRDADSIRADLRTVGLTPCDFWDCVEVATADVRWRRTWSGGSFQGTSRYCARHLAELRAGAAWATGDPRVVYLDDAVRLAAVTAERQVPLAAEPALDGEVRDGRQLDLLGVAAPVAETRLSEVPR